MWVLTYHSLYRVSQKKWNGGFLVHCELKVLHMITSLDRASSAEENDTKIIKFGWVILILWPFLEIRSFSNFAGFLRPMSGELWQDKPSITVFLWKPVDPWQQKKHGTMGFHRTTYGLFVPTKFFAHLSQKSSEIWKWQYFKKWS